MYNLSMKEIRKNWSQAPFFPKLFKEMGQNQRKALAVDIFTTFAIGIQL